MGLLELVKQEKEMRRIFGQQELKIIEKQLLGVELSPSERTRISRDIRPKFDLVRKLFMFEKEFKLKKAQEIKFLIEEAKEIILETKTPFKIKKIYVFGSYVENNMRENSDIDIAIEFKDINFKDASKFRAEIQGEVNGKIQVNIFNTLPEKIREDILRKGRIIYNYGKN